MNKKKQNPSLATLAEIKAKLNPQSIKNIPVASTTTNNESIKSGVIVTTKDTLPSFSPVIDVESNSLPELSAIQSNSVVLNKFSDYVGQTILVPIACLEIEDNVRSEVIEDEEFNALVISIQQQGLLQNLVARISRSSDGVERLIITSGQRRLIALRRLGILSVPCLIVSAEDSQTPIIIGLIENLMRENLPPINIGFAYLKLIDLGATKDELAITFGCSKKTINRYVSLTTWPPKAIDLLRKHSKLFSANFLFNEISPDILNDPDLLTLRLSKIVDHANNNNDEKPGVKTKPIKVKEEVITKWKDLALQTLKVPISMTGTSDDLKITIRCKGDDNIRRILQILGVTISE